MLHVIEAPLDIAAGVLGCRNGPEKLLHWGVGSIIKEKPHKKFYIPFSEGKEIAKESHVAAFSKKLSDRVYESLKEGDDTLVLGGDHSIAIGTISGISRFTHEKAKPLFVLWIDAHADFNTPETSPSGNIHGMPVAVLTGAGYDSLQNICPIRPALHEENIYMVGLRSVDPLEEKRLTQSKINAFYMESLKEKGIETITRELIEKVQALGGHLHVSFDVDGIDPEEASSVGTPEPGGIAAEDLKKCFRLIRESHLSKTLEVVEYNPTLPGAEKTGKIVSHLVKEFLG